MHSRYVRMHVSYSTSFFLFSLPRSVLIPAHFSRIFLTFSLAIDTAATSLSDISNEREYEYIYLMCNMRASV